MSEQVEFPQAIYRRDEISVADYFMSLREALTNEFMAGFSTLEEAVNTRGYNTLDKQDLGISMDRMYGFIRTLDDGSQEYKNNFDSWKTIGFRYECHDPNTCDVDWTREEDDIYSKLYPTAYGLVKKYGKFCPIANYSIMAPNSVLVRHTGPENRDGKYVRIHIPLIIPEGDIFLEVNGEEVNWSDLFAFNNQLPHSSHNLSPHYRLVFLIDLEREFLGMPKSPPYDERYESQARPFLRDGKEWHLYRHQDK
jgi:hypothetical protein